MTKKALKNKVNPVVFTKLKKGKAEPSPVDEAMKEDIIPPPDTLPPSGDAPLPEPEPITVVKAQTPRSELTITDEWSDVQGQKEDFEKEAKAAATAYRDKIKTLESKISDLHDEYVNACCDEVIDYETGVANYIHRRTGKIVRTRPLAGDDRQEELPFGVGNVVGLVKATREELESLARIPPPIDMNVTRDGHPYVVVKSDETGVTLEDQEDPSKILCLSLEEYYK